LLVCDRPKTHDLDKFNTPLLLTLPKEN
jgi:hypothetical protein